MSPQIRVLVVGGGIGGAFAAHALHRRGIEVHVYEQATRIAEIGAGIQLTPNSLRLLDRNGLADRIFDVGVPYAGGSCYYQADGTYVAPMVTKDSSGWNAVVGVHRADLLDTLIGALPDGVVEAGHRVVSFTQDGDAARLTFADGSTAAGDVAIGADGLHSTLSGYVEERSGPRDSHMTAYRGLVPAAQVPEWDTTIAQIWMGEGKHFLTFPVRSGNLVNYVGFVASNAQTKESWSAKGDPNELRSHFADGWDPQVRTLLDRVDETFWWGLYDRDPLTKWVDGRLVLLGDAAHPMLPHLGQGANQAIEDGAVLSLLLSQCASADAVPAALARFEQIRRPRTTEVQLGSRRNGDRYDSRGMTIADRNAEIVSMLAFRRSLYDYDAEYAATA